MDNAQLSLYSEDENTGKVIFNLKLPYANPSSLQIKDQEVYAAIYFYI